MACQSDKDGVLAIIHKDVLLNLVNVEFSKPFYRPYGYGNLEPDMESVSRSFKVVARLLEPISPYWSREVKAAASRLTVSSLVCRLVTTIKTHKSPVQVRLIHDASRNALNVVGSAINRVLEPFAREVSHLCFGSDQVGSKIRDLEVAERAVLLKFDVRDFYLSGEHEYIIEKVASSVPASHERSFLTSALRVVLNFQFVAELDPAHTGSTVRRVTKGSGIGMVHSGVVSDMVMATGVELPLLRNSQSFGIQLFLRFRDDVLAVCKDTEHARRFIEAYKRAAQEFCTVELENASATVTTFLDFTVFKEACGGCTRLRFRPYVKPTARHLPLSPFSVHPRSVHGSWPVAEAARLLKRCSHRADGEEWIRMKVAQWHHRLLDVEVLRRCRAVATACAGSEVAANFLGASGRSEGRFEDKRHLRLVLPYHPNLVGLQRAIMEFISARNAHFKKTLGSEFVLQISWCKAGRSLASLFSSGWRCGRR